MKIGVLEYKNNMWKENINRMDIIRLEKIHCRQTVNGIGMVPIEPTSMRHHIKRQ